MISALTAVPVVGHLLKGTAAIAAHAITHSASTVNHVTGIVTSTLGLFGL